MAVNVVHDALRAAAGAPSCVATGGPGDARRLAEYGVREAVDLVAVFGGDGTTMQAAAATGGHGRWPSAWCRAAPAICWPATSGSPRPRPRGGGAGAGPDAAHRPRPDGAAERDALFRGRLRRRHGRARDGGDRLRAQAPVGNGRLRRHDAAAHRGRAEHAAPHHGGRRRVRRERGHDPGGELRRDLPAVRPAGRGHHARTTGSWTSW